MSGAVPRTSQTTKTQSKYNAAMALPALHRVPFVLGCTTSRIESQAGSEGAASAVDEGELGWASKEELEEALDVFEGEAKGI